MIWHLLHFRNPKRSLNLTLKVSYLLLHHVYLLRKLRMILTHHFYRICCLALVSSCDLIFQGLMVFDFIRACRDDILVYFILAILLFEEVANKCEHRPYVVVRATETRILVDRLLKHLNLLTQFCHVVRKLLRSVAVLNQESIYEKSLFDGNLVPMLKWLGIFVVQSIQLEAENLWSKIDPVDLLHI